jgi:dCTP deaminase
MFAVQPIRIYAGVPICQIFYHEITGAFDEYDSKYQHNRDIQPSLLFQELTRANSLDPQRPLDFGLETPRE